MKKIEYKRHSRFDKQLKKLVRKYRSLEEDLENAQKYAIELLHILKIDNDSIKLVPKLDGESIQIYKIKKFTCKALKGKGIKSGIRIIYAFYPKGSKVEFLEIYFKEKSDSDMDYRFVKDYFNNIL
ncbi:MAG: mRNA-degrading endonuclease RelE of RelBE toxin-antitoxin system [Rickettsiales bacterium]|jgi:mRNA-degrading endonuclease RelE of RelBE toxin-antitoxin system